MKGALIVISIIIVAALTACAIDMATTVKCKGDCEVTLDRSGKVSNGGN